MNTAQGARYSARHGIRRALLRGALPVAISLLLAGCPGSDVDEAILPAPGSDTVLIGLITSTPTGEQIQRDQAARLAIEEINAAGGVNGKLLELRVAYDGNNDPDTGISSARRLLDEGVVAIIGPNSSRVTLAIANNVSIAAGLPVITHGGTSPRLTTLSDNDTVYRIPPSDTLQGRLLADKVLQEGHTRVAILAQDEPYGRGLEESFKQRFEAQSGQIQAEAFFPADQVSGFGSVISTLYANNISPDVLMLFGFENTTAAFLRELVASRGSLPPLYGVDGNMGASLGPNVGPQVAGMRGTIPAPPSSAAYQYFADQFGKRTGIAPAPNTENTYDAVYLVALALAASGQNTRQGVLSALRQVSRPDGSNVQIILPGEFATALTALAQSRDVDYQGASGAIDFDSNGDPTTATYGYYEIRLNSDNSFSLVLLETVNL